MEELDSKIWALVNTWSEGLYHKPPDDQRRLLMDMIKDLIIELKLVTLAQESANKAMTKLTEYLVENPFQIDDFGRSSVDVAIRELKRIPR